MSIFSAFWRYNLVQGVAYGLDLGSFTLLTARFATGLVLANVAAKLLAGIFAFLLHKQFTFDKSASGRTPREVAFYFSLLLVNIPLSSGILTILAAVLPATAAKIAADVSCLALSFLLTRSMVFRA